jgi:DNA ligase-1
MESSCKYRSGVDAAFPLSDHADFNELIEFVRQVRPRRVFTTHGFATDFAATLRDLGFDAEALVNEEQLTFSLGVPPNGVA